MLPRCKIEDNSRKLSVTVGAFRELVCQLVTGNYSNTKWHWEKDNVRLNSTDSSKYKFQVRNHESMLKIMNVDKSDQGNYTCVLTNDYDVHSQTIEFEVIGKKDRTSFNLMSDVPKAFLIYLFLSNRRVRLAALLFDCVWSSGRHHHRFPHLGQEISEEEKPG